MPGRLDTRTLNRTLLERQLLLERVDMSPLEVVELLVGIQAQEPQAPYQALWCRIAGFDAEALSRLLEERAVARSWLMRTTIHLVARADCLELAPAMRDANERRFGSTAAAKATAELDRERLVSAAEMLLAERPRTRSELGAALAEEWPGVDPSALAYAATYLLACVQVPPRGLWRRSGAARITTLEEWLGAPASSAASLDGLVRRYLRAFGPATAADFRAWSGLAAGQGLPWPEDLRMYGDERGRILYDIPDGELADTDTAAPVRFLAPFDNAILGHRDRSRIVPEAFRERLRGGDRLMRVFLVDGFVAGNWTIADGTLSVQPFRSLSSRETKEVRAEAEQLLDFLVPPGKKRALEI